MPSLSHMLIAAGLLSMSAGAIAQPPAPPPGGPGGPGRFAPHMQLPITRTELKAQLEAQFTKLDANKDGKLSPEDREARRTERRDLAFSRLDADKNGSISKAEFAAAKPGPGAGQGDGPAMHRAAMGWRGHMPHRGPGRGPWGAGPGPEGQQPQTITKADFVARGLARFDKVDTDHDGTLSQAERDAARPAMRDKRGPGRTMPPPPPPAAPKGQ